jgi:hypothetical protein
MEKIGTPADWQVVGSISPKFALVEVQAKSKSNQRLLLVSAPWSDLKFGLKGGRVGEVFIYCPNYLHICMCMYITITRSWQGFWPGTQKHLDNEQFTWSVYIYIHKHKQRYPFTSARSQSFAFNYSVYILPMKIRLFCIVFRKIDVKSCVNW